ncbi:MAG: hypothetical protein DI568_08525 [Sphingomonas sp.]|nr:MAG: hypothetical protein DI568_08525 [Sphingomonas sp.]
MACKATDPVTVLPAETLKGTYHTRTLASVAGGVALSLALAFPALAQIAPPGPRIQYPDGAVIDDPERIYGDDADGFSPLAIVGALGLSVNAGLVTEYSDNVARMAEGQPLSSRFESKDDWIFRPTAGVAFERPLGRNRIFGAATIGRNIYARNHRLNSNRFGVSGGGDFQIGQACNGQVTGGWSKRDTQLGSFEEVVASQQTRTRFGGSVGCSTMMGLTGRVGYNRSSVRNDTDDPNYDRTFADVDSHLVNASLGYRVGLRGQVGVAGSWAENRYINQIIDGEVNTNEIRTVSVFGNYRIGNSLNASGSIGRTRLTSNTPGSVGFSGATWSLGVGYAGPRIGANIGMGRSVNGGRGVSANYTIQQFYNLSTTYSANDRLRFSTGYSHTKVDLRGIAALPETEVASQNVNNRFFVGSDYSLNSFLRLGLDFNHHRRSSTPSNFSYKVNSVIFSIKAHL